MYAIRRASLELCAETEESGGRSGLDMLIHDTPLLAVEDTSPSLTSFAVEGVTLIHGLPKSRGFPYCSGLPYCCAAGSAEDSRARPSARTTRRQVLRGRRRPCSGLHVDESVGLIFVSVGWVRVRARLSSATTRVCVPAKALSLSLPSFCCASQLFAAVCRVWCFVCVASVAQCPRFEACPHANTQRVAPCVAVARTYRPRRASFFTLSCGRVYTPTRTRPPRRASRARPSR